MPSASEAKQNDAEGGGDYPDGEWSDFDDKGLFTLPWQVPLRQEKKLKTYYVWILPMKKLRQHSGKLYQVHNSWSDSSDLSIYTQAFWRHRRGVYNCHKIQGRLKSYFPFKPILSIWTLKMILKEMDEDFTEDELDEIIAEIDTDKSDTIDFNEFVKIMTWHHKT